MAELKELTAYLDDLLKIKDFPHDASNNGLQFEGGRTVNKAVFGVDGSNALFSIAADLDADFVFVHHGISWGSSLKRIVSLDARRIAMLAANSISLYAAHLPLDAQPEIGHNALLADMLKLKAVRPFGEYCGKFIGFSGTLPRETTLEKIYETLDKKLASEGDFFCFGELESKVSKVGIISGGGAFPEAFSEAFEKGIDCLITGEMGHSACHYAREAGVSVLAMGHYRTETPGVLAVMECVRKQFGIEVEFVDLPTGM